MPGLPVKAERLAQNSKEPPGSPASKRRFMCRAPSRTVWKAPCWLTASRPCHASLVISTKLRSLLIRPALAITPSTRPISSTASAIAATTRDSSLTSTDWVRTRPPNSTNVLAASAFFSARRPQITTSPPARAIPRANPSPIPALPPLIRTTRPRKLNTRYCYHKIDIASRGRYIAGVARPAPAAARAATIISFLTAHPSRAFTISELVRHLDMNIASAHATIAVLTDCGFLVRDPAHKTYTLGPALAATGFAAMAQHPAVAAAIEQAELLSEELDVEVGVSAIAGRDVILLARRGPEPLSTAIGYPGDRAPLLAPFGAVFMAWADDATVDEWLQRADADAAARNFYGQALAEIRTRGFSVPLQAIASPEIEDAMLHLRDEPTAADAEGRLKQGLR